MLQWPQRILATHGVNIIKLSCIFYFSSKMKSVLGYIFIIIKLENISSAKMFPYILYGTYFGLKWYLVKFSMENNQNLS